MKRGLILSLMLTVMAPSAEAAIRGCYERIYDARYLRTHKRQDVIKMRFQFGTGQGLDGPFEYLDRLDAGFRKKQVYRGGLVDCQPSGEGLICAIEGDGGTFTVTDRGMDKGRQAIRITNGGFMRFGDEQDGITISGKGENREFRLYRISKGPCP
jgi:hypothetical protein